jgi:hypothetical protein
VVSTYSSRRLGRDETPAIQSGGPELWHEFMAELRTIHLSEPASERDGASVTERLAKAYASAP